MKTRLLGASAVAVVSLGLSGGPEVSDQYSEPAALCAAADPAAWFAANVDSETLTYQRFLDYSPSERAVITRRGSE